MRANIVWDARQHPTVHLGMTNHEGESDAAYLRKTVEFYELNKGGATNQQKILEELVAIKTMLRRGVSVASSPATPDAGQADEILDELLEQL